MQFYRPLKPKPQHLFVGFLCTANLSYDASHSYRIEHATPAADHSTVQMKAVSPSMSMVMPFLKSAVESIESVPAPPLVFRGAVAVHRTAVFEFCTKDPFFSEGGRDGGGVGVRRVKRRLGKGKPNAFKSEESRGAVI